MLLKKEFTFDAAHMLTNHLGDCKNLHGHTYKLLIELESYDLEKEGSSAGMIMDFKDIKKVIGKFLSRIDHSFIFNCNNKEQDTIARILESQEKKVFMMWTETTVENMCIRFLEELKDKIPNLYSVEIYETPTSSCKAFLGETQWR